MRNRNRSEHDVLSKSQSRRISHLMIRCLQKFEEVFPDLEDSPDGRRFKGDLRNAFNDAMRAARDELNDYDVEYRPMRMGDDNILALTRTMMETVRRVSFGVSDKTGLPFMTMSASTSKGKVLDAVRAEFGCGVIVSEDSVLRLVIVGTQDCVNRVIPIMDKYRLAEGVRDQYRVWREAVVRAYCQETGDE